MVLLLPVALDQTELTELMAVTAVAVVLPVVLELPVVMVAMVVLPEGEAVEVDLNHQGMPTLEPGVLVEQEKFGSGQ